MTSRPRPPEPAAIFREEALRWLSDRDHERDDEASAVALPAGLLRRLWIAATVLGLPLLAVAVRIAQISR
ncbi:MAG: hypothetical protein ACQSGP_13180 [Frankia sp.]